LFDFYIVTYKKLQYIFPYTRIVIEYLYQCIVFVSLIHSMGHLILIVISHKTLDGYKSSLYFSTKTFTICNFFNQVASELAIHVNVKRHTSAFNVTGHHH